jgi:hypothetical protein
VHFCYIRSPTTIFFRILLDEYFFLSFIFNNLHYVCRPQGMEIVFIEELFPSGIPVEEQTKHWILSFSTFDENEKRALQVILSQKQR